jgi:cytochrome P450/NADPH-cytochrome P450 reductase
MLVDYTEVPAEKAALVALSGDGPDATARYRDVVLGRNRSLLDLLEDYPSCKLPFNLFVELVPTMRPRYFSISSSPLLARDEASITVGVIEGPARSGQPEGRGR